MRTIFVDAGSGNSGIGTVPSYRSVFPDHNGGLGAVADCTGGASFVSIEDPQRQGQQRQRRRQLQGRRSSHGALREISLSMLWRRRRRQRQRQSSFKLQFP